MLSNIQKIRQGGNVKRWHITPIIGEQTVAAHSWGVACILLELYPEASANLIKAALYHDVAEGYTGDLPAQVKWEYEGLDKELKKVEARIEAKLGIQFELTTKEASLLKIADTLELLIFCVEQVTLGNKNMVDVFNRARIWLTENHRLNTDMDLLVSTLNREIKK